MTALSGAGRGIAAGVAIAAVLPWLGACSTAYQEPGASNLHFRTSSTANLLGFTTVFLDISHVTADCRAEPVGSVNLWAPLPLRPPAEAVHLPEEQLSKLAFRFVTNGGNSRSVIVYETLLRPRAGRVYEATVSYGSDLYDVDIRETGAGGAPGRRIEHRALSDCHGV